MDVFAKIFSTRGRLSRGLHAKYHSLWLVLNMLAGFTSSFFAAFLTGTNDLGYTIAGILFYIWLIGALMVSARRLHDLGWEGRFALALLIPGVGVLLAVYLFGAAGQIGANKYGEASEN